MSRCTSWAPGEDRCFTPCSAMKTAATVVSSWRVRSCGRIARCHCPCALSVSTTKHGPGQRVGFHDIRSNLWVSGPARALVLKTDSAGVRVTCVQISVRLVMRPHDLVLIPCVPPASLRRWDCETLRDLTSVVAIGSTTLTFSLFTSWPDLSDRLCVFPSRNDAKGDMVSVRRDMHDTPVPDMRLWLPFTAQWSVHRDFVENEGSSHERKDCWVQWSADITQFSSVWWRTVELGGPLCP
ncbi:hypothetical protein DPEC_G00068450 [Dallia pectoralis]|uniref:Uncharacterized protein n=1 Tax=Dallia pectoralis TaxID=75939 RepID=A0ACC2H2U6_DALPE|nr:hypothetical protein DPEC_G00068450 [Dallia pectoralis]